ncbi:TAF5-like RNA polymerase II p300/CBP-associated factor-associated factor 65 kDa subunit 5L [Amphibalanus amphitrite]|uniref:TAF5-like RNA polymerase II p300/CBP-associated factor-associated factor 65 kDa subunit 5L n=1 Tax=Amphibalanus amphitrite TaxID=1232801 RepID=UPI001C906F1E|nr:TAF5-like RNA polymerase II p300/CBP-associated factor-associated factor 65 kDa subunit 5L [Amphibalanus amphitrite]XP_043220314.1 TAF5-like RNA polymerase II p300/CBP-associated factor-associated factor 65 kDa subunit 5L [Amphibalanus amphitrite]
MSAKQNGDLHESVNEVIHSYLKRRNLCAESKEGEQGTQPLGELAADSVADAAASAANVMLNSAAQMEPTAADTQFARFREWVQESPAPYQAALQPLLAPVFVGLHIELVLGGHSPARFYARHHGALLGDPGHQSLLPELAAVSTADHLERPPLKHFRRNPPDVSLSPECSEYLRRSLRSSQLTLVLQTLSQHVRLSGCAGRPAPEAEPDRRGRRRYLTGSGPPGGLQRLTAAAEDCDLARAGRRLRAEPPPPPTVCAYRVHRPLTCAVAAPRLDALVTAGDGGASVWALTADGLPGRPNAAARLPLAGDDGAPPAAAAGAPSRHLRAHAGPVFDMVFEPTGGLLLTAGEDTTVRAWDPSSWSNVAIYRGHSYPVWSVACQPRSSVACSHYFVTGSMDRTARLWSYDRTHQLRIFAGHSQDVDCVAMHPNGNYVCSASADGTVRLWSLTDAAQVRVLSGHRGIIHSMHFSPDGKRLAAAGEDQQVRVYDLACGAMLSEHSGHLAPVSRLLWTADGRTLVSADQDGVINVWNLAHNSDADASPAFSFVCAGSATVGLQQAPHNYLVAVYGDPC